MNPRKSMMCVALGALACTTIGCFPPPETTVRLVNSASFPVEVELFYDDDQNLPEDLIESTGIAFSALVQPGTVENFSRDCVDLQAIFIKRADLRVIGSIGPSASTRVYREPNDFGCGDIITFTFTENVLATDLDIGFSRQ